MRLKASSKSSLFLLEMMICIVFFAAAAAGCVQVFARAHLFSQEAEELNMAQSLAASAVEELSCLGEPFERYYDSDWQECEEEPVYQVTAEMTQEGRMGHLQVQVQKVSGEQTVLYTLETDRYVPYTKKEASDEKK